MESLLGETDTVCPNCSRGDRATAAYTLRVEGRDADQRDLTLSLCEPCLADLLALEWVTRLDVADE